MSQTNNSSMLTASGRVFRRSLRVFWFFLKVGVGLLALLWLSKIPGEVLISIADIELRLSLSFTLAVLALAISLLWLFIGVLKGLLGFTNFWRERRERKNRRIADLCLKNGLFAFFAEDYTLAITQLRRAIKHDPLRKGVFESIMGVSALNNDQRDLAHEYFEDLLKDPQHRFMGYFGLYHLDPEKSLSLLERAVEELPENPWLIEKLRQALIVEAQKGTLEALHRAESLTHKLYEIKAISKQKRNEMRAGLLWGQAQYHQQKGETGRAFELAQLSHDLDLTLAGPVIMLAERDNAQKAQKLLMKTFAVNPEPSIAAAITRLLPKTVETFHAFEVHFEGNQSPSVLFLLALLAFHAKLWGRSRQLLQKIPETARDGNYYLMLAQLGDAERDDEHEKPLHHSDGGGLLRVVK